jgi:hypothetical protein
MIKKRIDPLGRKTWASACVCAHLHARNIQEVFSDQETWTNMSVLCANSIESSSCPTTELKQAYKRKTEQIWHMKELERNIVIQDVIRSCNLILSWIHPLNPNNSAVLTFQAEFSGRLKEWAYQVGIDKLCNLFTL